jgi:hypothetical protein
LYAAASGKICLAGGMGPFFAGMARSYPIVLRANLQERVMPAKMKPIIVQRGLLYSQAHATASNLQPAVDLVPARIRRARLTSASEIPSLPAIAAGFIPESATQAIC